MPTTEYEPRRPSYQEFLAAFDRARATYEQNPNADTLAVLETGFQILMHELQQPGKFELGQLVMTPGADSAMRVARQLPVEFLLRHQRGDWGDLDQADVEENDRALREGSRVFSAYRTRIGDKLWVITEWDRSLTTILQPDEY